MAMSKACSTLALTLPNSSTATQLRLKGCEDGRNCQLYLVQAQVMSGKDGNRPGADGPEVKKSYNPFKLSTVSVLPLAAASIPSCSRDLRM